MSGAQPIYWLTFGRWYLYNGQYSKCHEYELDFMRCANKCGVGNTDKCWKFFEDWKECYMGTKQKHRVAVMLNERKRQKRPEIQAPPDDLIKHAKDLA